MGRVAVSSNCAATNSSQQSLPMGARLPSSAMLRKSRSLHPKTARNKGQFIQLFSFPHATQASPTFSPDGKTLAFVSDKDGSPRIYTIPASTSGKRAQATLISKAYKESTCPCWSPDGKKLAYSTKIDGVRQICLYDFAPKRRDNSPTVPTTKKTPHGLQTATT